MADSQQNNSNNSNTNEDRNRTYLDERTPSLDPINIGDESVDEIQQFLDSGDQRTLDGYGNNANNPYFSNTDQPLIRLTDAEYGENGSARGVVDGQQTLANERVISNTIADQDDDGDGQEDATVSLHGTNQLLTSFGQYFDHGLDFLQRSSDPNEKYYIPLDESDPLYKFSDDGNPFNDVTSIAIKRGEGAINPETGEVYTPRAHINKTSPFIDQSQVYGSDDAIGYYLRQSATDENGNVLYDDDGLIIKHARLKTGDKDVSGYDDLPTYRDILVNNGMSEAVIDAAIAANDFDMLRAGEHFVDFRNVIDPETGKPSGHPLLADVAHDANPAGHGSFNLEKLLDHHVAGDGRLNENVALTSLHTVFFRDHNFWIETLQEKAPHLSQEELYQSAKLIVGAEYQRIVYEEFIPALAGSIPGQGPNGFNGYQSRVDGQISEEFAHAVYRVGHSMVTEKIPYTTEDGTIKEISLVEAFLSPAKYEELGVDSIISGSTKFSHERIDENIVNAIRNQLLGRPSDLAAINIARGREVGIQTLNDVRRALYDEGSNAEVNGSDVTRALKGNEELKPYENWEEFAANLRDPSLVEVFKEVYDTVDDVDLWIGGLAEKPRSATEGQMGTTFTWIFWEQMDRLQDGDKFYYNEYFKDTEILAILEHQNFSDILMRNTGQEFLADEVFALSKQVKMGATEKTANFDDISETIVANDLDNVIRAGGGNDTVYGQDGNDIIYGEAGNDGLRGEDGNDYLLGGEGDDRLVGGNGNDYLDGGKDNDSLHGNGGNDRLFGRAGDDVLNGDAGNDRIYGGAGNDELKGGLGDDLLVGGKGDDFIQTNGGDDKVYTGTGKDIVLMSENEGQVTIKDFNINKDRVDLTLFDVRNIDDLLATVSISSDGGSTILEVGDSKITLKSVRIEDLSHGNFKFDHDDRNVLLNGRMDEQQIVVVDGEISLREFDEDGNENEHSVGWRNEAGDRVHYGLDQANQVLIIEKTDSQNEIYQDVPTRSGETYHLTFDAAKATLDVDGAVEVLWNGELVGTIDPIDIWKTFEMEVVGTGGNDRLTFRSDSSVSNDQKTKIDNVVLAPNYTDGNNNGDVNIIDGTEYSDYLSGTDENDLINLKGGVDVVNGSAGDDIINGGDLGYNQVDYDGSSSDYTFVRNQDQTITVTKPTGTDILTDIRGIWFKGEAVWKPIEELVTSGGDIIGTDGDDYIIGTSGDDNIDAGLGRDTIRGSDGNDIINGGGSEYNQVDYAGSSSDYVFVKNDDGSYSVTSDNGYVDVLTNIDGIWFEGEAVWKPIDELVTTGGDIIGTDGDDYIVGTSGDDNIDGGLGNDTIRGSSGNDIINGGGPEYNQVDYAGSSDDYTFTKSENGSYQVTDDEGYVDVLTNIEGIWFEEEEQWYQIDSLV
ncbi:peroxidase family protein [Lentilitoribacter sp. EG35]|uniref:peroxidase family protein n=1 Tax=Lentilitoribacter sp. EG35 TaxID=3234192 RepID=UPI00345F3939